jgi:hypothetical protein
MSFKKPTTTTRLLDAPPVDIVSVFRNRVEDVADAAKTTLTSGLAKAHLGDSRRLDGSLDRLYTAVITSPPYPNRMSYIRLPACRSYLTNGRDAGELDWQAIGGTWGCATSNLNSWIPNPATAIPFDQFNNILAAIATRSSLLSRYVHRYFEDCVLHFRSLGAVLQQGAVAHYIVGNSKFYDAVVPTEEIYAAIMGPSGFEDVRIERLRKRNSKKELFEFDVQGRFATC